MLKSHNFWTKDWDDSAEKVKKSHPKHQHLNRLRTKYDQLDDIVYEAERSKKQLSAKQITDKIRDVKNNNSFFDFANEHVEDLEICGDFNIGKELVKYSKKYIAIDIVPDLIAHNKKEFKADNLEFQALDIAKDDLPSGDCAILRGFTTFIECGNKECGRKII